MDHNGDCIERDGQLDEADTGRAASIYLFREDRSRRVRDVCITPAQLLETAAGAGKADRDANTAAL